ncbi:MAG: DUF5916 domain-containing protein [Vicinamibacterales bacterium]
MVKPPDRARVRRCRRWGALLLALLLGAGSAARAQTPAVQRGAAGGWTIDGPPPPLAPDVMTRDELGRATVRAVRIAVPIRIDGRVDDQPYDDVPPMTDFIQMEPYEGQPATEKTDVWVFFDDRNIYVTARCYESHPERMIVNELRYDNANITQNDYVAFGFDTFYDRRNGYGFTVNPLAGRIDGQVTAEKQWNGDLNLIWQVQTSRFEGGWVMEAAVPFKSLRTSPVKGLPWGFQMLRYSKWKNEGSFLTRVSNARGGPGGGWMAVSQWTTLVGLEIPASGRVLEIKPYAITDLTSDRVATPRVDDRLGGKVGVDAKYTLTRNLAADLTWNTDFAQVEADEQQLNLTRFSLFFPEKREFFLENQGTFAFGTNTTTGAGDLPLLFYSRRIGLSASAQAVPLVGGARLTGRLGRYSVGAINIGSQDDAASRAVATNFSVLRVRRDVLKRSALGLIYTGRSVGQGGTGRNDVFGVDGVFAFYQNVFINTYWARSATPGLRGSDTSYRGQFDYAADRYGFQVDHLLVGDNFRPEMGFVRRDDMRKTFVQARFSPRLRQGGAIRKLFWTASQNYIATPAGRRDYSEQVGEFAVELNSSDRFTAGLTRTFEYLPAPFAIAARTTVPAGGYDYTNVRLAYQFGNQRKAAGTVTVERGSLYGGHKTTLSVSRGRIEITPRFAVEPTFSINAVSLPFGRFNTNLAGSRVTYTVTPLMFVSALTQYNSATRSVATNVRMRWQYLPGSDLFVVYNEQRDTAGRAFPDLANRTLVVKVNRLVRF